MKGTCCEPVCLPYASCRCLPVVSWEYLLRRCCFCLRCPDPCCGPCCGPCCDPCCDPCGLPRHEAGPPPRPHPRPEPEPPRRHRRCR
ncbi:MAG: hypothetical protein J6T26_10775 [Firmicutes bacterium]|nr:hypothetical protein [Bacillota bacterium]